jgi:hypothetical protein
MAKDDNALDQRLINFCRAKFLGVTLEPPMKILVDLFPFFTIETDNIGSRVEATFFDPTIQGLPSWSTRMILKSIVATSIFIKTEPGKLPGAVRLLSRATKEIEANIDEHTETLKNCSPTLTSQDLLFVIAQYQYQIQMASARNTPQQKSLINQGFIYSGKMMIDALPDRPEGYFVAGCGYFEQGNADDACVLWRKGVEVAATLGHRFYSSLLKYKLALGIESGGEGETYTFGTVFTLIEEARKESKMLKYYNATEKKLLIEVQKVAERRCLTGVTETPKMDDVRTASKIGVGTTAGAAGSSPSAMKNVCDECGCQSTTVQFCSACNVAKYCSKDCQKAAWKGGHKGRCAVMKIGKAIGEKTFLTTD